jgi:NADH dehydrogenase
MRVLVLGAGYAGMTAARRLESRLPDDVDLVVVDDTGTHVLQHEVHRVIRRPAVAEHITLELDDVLDDAEVMEARVDDVDPAGNAVTLDNGETIDYDVAAVCLGSETDFHDLPGVEAHAVPCKRVAHATQIREDFLDALDAGGHAVVGGAGLSGVQVAGELAALRDERLGDDAVSESDEESSGVAGTDVTVTLLEMAETVAPGFPEQFQSAVHDALRSAGVDVRTNATVERATADAVTLADGTTLSVDAFIWTGGIRGPDATGGDRLDARADLRVDDGTFVVGDAANVVDADGEPVPASAQSAIAQGRVAARNVATLVEHRRSGDAGSFEPSLDRLRFDAPGWIVSVGDDAVAQVGPSVLTGRAAVALKATVGAGYLSGVGELRRATALVNDELGLDPGDDPSDDAGDDAGDDATQD